MIQMKYILSTFRATIERDIRINHEQRPMHLNIFDSFYFRMERRCRVLHTGAMHNDCSVLALLSTITTAFDNGQMATNRRYTQLTVKISFEHQLGHLCVACGKTVWALLWHRKKIVLFERNCDVEEGTNSNWLSYECTTDGWWLCDSKMENVLWININWKCWLGRGSAWNKPIFPIRISTPLSPYIFCAVHPLFGGGWIFTQMNCNLRVKAFSFVGTRWRGTAAEEKMSEFSVYRFAYECGYECMFWHEWREHRVYPLSMQHTLCTTTHCRYFQRLISYNVPMHFVKYS